MAVKFTKFHVPEDPEYLKALGAVSVRHAHLDRILVMTVKTLAKVSPQEAIDATAHQGSQVLRDRVLALARREFGEGKPLIQIQALMQRCATLTGKRNDWLHSICAKELDGKPLLVSGSQTKPMPKASQLQKLADDLATITSELNNARLNGFIAEAMLLCAKPKKKKKK